MAKRSEFLVFVVFFSILAIINAILLGTHSLKWGWEGVGIMTSAGFTIAMYSFLYHDNPEVHGSRTRYPSDCSAPTPTNSTACWLLHG